MKSVLRHLVACALGIIAGLALAPTPAYAVCAAPGRDGPATLTGIVNTYHAGTQALAAAGATSLSIGAGTGATTPIAAGDLLLIIQMQGSDLSTSDSTNYGANDGTGRGYTSIGEAGQYEFVVAANNVALAGGTLNLTTALQNSYVSAAPTGTRGQSRYQIIRVPQYSSATLTSGLTARAWNGSTGGVLAIDVAGQLTLGGATVSVTGAGFRGGGARQSGSGSGSNAIYRVASTNGAHGSKGEGTTGTPRFVFDGTSVIDNGAGNEGYPNGSFGRGAPGNAGGGGNDGNPATNDQNAGGGGGGNGGIGGRGGNTWNTSLVVGGIGGAALPVGPSRLFLGGGGGAGSRNNSTGTQSSGGVGGGIIFIRAGSVSGTATLNANGTTPPSPANDAAGGGGAGGTIVTLAGSGSLAGITLNANGANGANAWPTSGQGSSCSSFPDGGCNYHGPGGGGGGGVVLTSGGGSISTAAGNNGTTTTAANAYGALPGAAGSSNTSIAPAQIPGGGFGAQCLPQLTVTKATVPTGPVSVPIGGVATYRITVSNAAGQGLAEQVSISDVLPGVPSAFSNQSAAPTVALSGGATRPSTSDAAVGATTPAWASFSIPGGGSVQLEFSALVPVPTDAGTYQNPATATYQDPVRTAPAGTASANYDPATSTDEDVIVARPLGAPQGSGCPAGTSIFGPNLVSNGDFASGTSGWSSGVTINATDTYPPETRVAVQNGAKNYATGAVQQSTFPGDPGLGIAASNSWLESNGNTTNGVDVLWQQTVSGLVAGRTYAFFAYVSNAANPGTTPSNLPQPGLEVQGLAGTVTFTLANETLASGDEWARIQRAVVATGTSHTLRVLDAAARVRNGDDMAITQIGMFECRAGGSVTGSVYADSQPNGARDAGEGGTGQALFVKLVPRVGGVCTGPATAVVAADPSTGAYSFSGVTAGDYCALVDTNNTLADISAGAPASWTFMTPAGGSQSFTIGAGNVSGLDFGLYSGSTLTGRVFQDNGVAGGTPNDGALNGGEPGIPGVTVQLTDASGATIYATATTDGSGAFALSIPSTLTTGAVLRVREIDPVSVVSTGGQVGTTAGTYARAQDATTFTLTAGASYSGVNFGDVPPSSFTTDGMQTALAGTTLYYPHTFNAGTAGSVSFTVSAASAPTIPGWNEVVVQDANCNGAFDAGEGALSGPTVLAAGARLCILVKEFVPANAPYNGQNVVTVTATFDYVNAAPALASQQARTDTTLVGQASGAGLKLVKTVSAASALPGSTLVYTITYTNVSSEPITSIVVGDAVPAFTQAPSACCVSPAGACLGAPAAPLPNAITACTPNIAGATSGSAITWTLTGTLTPGQSGEVRFSVQVQP